MVSGEPIQAIRADRGCADVVSGGHPMFGWFRKKESPVRDDTPAGRAAGYFRRGDFAEALRRADEILAAGPNVAFSWRFKGECLFHLARHAEAAECFQRAAELGGPGTEEIFLWRALALHNGGNNEQATQVVWDFLESGRGTPELIAKAQDALVQLGALDCTPSKTS